MVYKSRLQGFHLKLQILHAGNKKKLKQAGFSSTPDKHKFKICNVQPGSVLTGMFRQVICICKRPQGKGKNMETPEDKFLDACLFFNCNTFSRQLVKLAENEFRDLNLSPAHATLLLLVFDSPGITPKVLSEDLELNPSTITRFIDALVKKKFVAKQNRGKSISIHPTSEGLAIRGHVAQAYKNLVFKYSQILGRDTAAELSLEMRTANEKVKKAIQQDAQDS